MTIIDTMVRLLHTVVLLTLLFMQPGIAALWPADECCSTASCPESGCGSESAGAGPSGCGPDPICDADCQDACPCCLDRTPAVAAVPVAPRPSAAPVAAIATPMAEPPAAEPAEILHIPKSFTA